MPEGDNIDLDLDIDDEESQSSAGEVIVPSRDKWLIRLIAIVAILGIVLMCVIVLGIIVLREQG